MMKKNGFTLAEVLITLSIIGVVATMTLPALMTNTAEQQAKTGLKKAVNTLTEAVQMNQAIENYDYATLGTKQGSGGYGNIAEDRTADVNKQSLAYIFHNRLLIDYAKTDGTAKISSQGAFENNQTIVLKDGTAVLIPAAGTALPEGWNTMNENDDLANGFVVVYDTNGLKAPNILSNCAGTVGGALETPDTVGDDNYTVCGEKGKRVIKDQFALRLRGTVVQPEGPAAWWAYSN